MPDATDKYFSRDLGTSLERLDECHWHLHEIEKHYHEPRPFRYAFNAFLRSIKEIPQIAKMGLQARADFPRHKRTIDALNDIPLLKVLKRKRDYLVHQGSLELLSTGHIGVTRGHGFKIGVPFPIHPRESSEDAYARFKAACRSSPRLRAFAGPDETTRPMLCRSWRLPEFDKDLLEIAVDAFEAVSQSLVKIALELTGESIPATLSCRHEPAEVRCIMFSRREFVDEVDNVSEDPTDEGPGSRGR